ncbi:SCO6745 family protein [Mycolicibacterium psychrotolerans]|uniref:SCO6745 family protein n=1 Tax=Mycolicibacterium psychrotolerans TaxID=216929 RepID=UPI003D67F53D
MSRTPALARRFFDRYEPVHGITYFAPGVRSAFDAMGFVGFWRGYFAGRSAPLGRVPVELVTATFYNFSTERVAKAIPAIWDVAAPEELVRVRQDTAVAALQDYGLSDDTPGVAEAAELAGLAARSAPLDGRPLFAANRALPWPDAPLAALWHAATLLREHRGDGHIAVLVSEGISGRESNVFHVGAGAVPADFIKRSRDYSDDEWDSCVRSLQERELLTPTGTLTEAGRALKEHIEVRTDTLSLPALDALDNDSVERLFRALTPITRQVIAGGDLPAATPMALRRDELDDDSAHL